MLNKAPYAIREKERDIRVTVKRSILVCKQCSYDDTASNKERILRTKNLREALEYVTTF